jgi:cellulase/cellobiase CelA1
MRFLAIFLAILYIYIPHFVFAENIVASQSITSDWGIGFCGNISLKNTGTTEASWSELTFVLSSATVTSLWGGNVSHTGDAYTVKSLSWNQKIAPGSSTDVGYCGQ